MDLSEDPGPHAVFFSWGRWEGGVGISRVVVVVVGDQKDSQIQTYCFCGD